MTWPFKEASNTPEHSWIFNTQACKTRTPASKKAMRADALMNLGYHELGCRQCLRVLDCELQNLCTAEAG